MNPDHTVEWCRDNAQEDEIGLVTCEGLHLLVQLRNRYGVDLCGSSYNGDSAPCIAWCPVSQSRLDSVEIDCQRGRFCSVFRGSLVMPVTVA